MEGKNLYQKLIEIRKDVINFHKDTKSFGYEYVSGGQAIGKIRTKMDELNLILTLSIGDTIYEKYDYKNGKGEEKTDFIVSGDMKYIWINADKPEEKLEIPWKLYGQQDDISKAFGSGLTYSERYFILKFFQAPTDDLDPDGRDTSGRSSNYSSSKYNQNNKKKENNNAQKDKLHCEKCGKAITEKIANFSKSKYGKVLCMDCQKSMR